MKKTLTTIVAVAGVATIAAYLTYRGVVRENSQPEKIIERATEAITQRDILACEGIQGKVGGVDYQVVCKNNVILQEAVERKNFVLCEGVDGNLVSQIDCERQVLAAVLEEGGGGSCAEVPESVEKECREIQAETPLLNSPGEE